MRSLLRVVLVRRPRKDPLSALMFALVAGAAVFLAAATPRVLESTQSTALRVTAADALSSVRDLQFTTVVDSAQQPDIASVEATAQRLKAGLPEALRAVVWDETWAIESGRFRVQQASSDPIYMYLRIQERALDRVDVVDGRLPSGTTQTVELQGDDGLPVPVTVFEGALSTSSLAALQAHVGDTLTLTPDGADDVSQWRFVTRVAVRIVGAYEVGDAGQPYWRIDPGPTGPNVRSLGGGATAIDTVVLLSQGAYAAFSAAPPASPPPGTLPLQRFRWRFLVDPQRLSAANVEAVAAAARELTSKFSTTQGTRADQDRMSIRTGLLGLISGHLDAWRSAAGILLALAVGVVLVALVSLVVVAQVVMTRRRAEIEVWRTRGASRRRVMSQFALEGLLLVAPAGAIAVVVARLLWPAAAPSGSSRGAVPVVVELGFAWLPLAVAVGAVAALVAAGWLCFSTPSRAVERTGGTDRSLRSAARLATELLVVVLAVGATWYVCAADHETLRPASAAVAQGQMDALLVSVPALVALAAGLVARRIIPFLLAIAARVAARGRGLAAVLGLRRGARVPAGVLMVSLLATSVIATFGSAVLLGFRATGTGIAAQDVGAAFRIEVSASRFTSDLDPSTTPGVTGVAAATRTSATVGPRGRRIEVLVLDAKQFDAMGTSDALPAGFGRIAQGEAVPALVSPGIVGETGKPLHLGEVTTLDLAGRRPTIVVAGIVDRFPSLAPDRAFAVLSRGQLLESVPASVLPVTTYFVAADESAAASLGDVAQRLGARLYDRAAIAADLMSSPIPSAVQVGVAILTIAVMVVGAVGLAAALAVLGLARRVELASLRALGLGARAPGTLIAAEWLPLLVGGWLAGTALGWLLFEVMRASLGLGAILGSGIGVNTEFEPWLLVPMGLSACAVIVIGLALGAGLSRRTIATVLRSEVE